MELLLFLLLNMELLIWKKYHTYSLWNGTPLVPITKYGAPYVKKFHTHSLQNIELLMPLLLNMEHLMWKSPTPIHYETRNPSWHNYEMSKALCSDLLLRNTEPLMPKSLFYKNSNLSCENI